MPASNVIIILSHLENKVTGVGGLFYYVFNYILIKQPRGFRKT